jgi:hypothetical protein
MVFRMGSSPVIFDFKEAVTALPPPFKTRKCAQRRFRDKDFAKMTQTSREMLEPGSPVKRRSIAVLAALAIALVCCLGLHRPLHAEPAVPRQVDNLRAFAKLYGYVRWFHPGDAAAETDWDALARHGVAAVRDAESADDLRRTLEALFVPIAPTVQVYRQGNPPPRPEVLSPPDAADLDLVAWQHLGVDVGFERGIYKSRRLHRGAESEGSRFGTVTQGIDDATPYRGHEVRLRAAIRAEVEGAGNQGQLWMRVDRASGERGFFSKMADRPVTSSDWSVHEITGTVAGDATAIYFGGLLGGDGMVWLDDFEVAVRGGPEDGWTPVTIDNPGFEDGDGTDRPPGWARGAEDASYEYDLVREAPHGGRQALRIGRTPGAPETLFAGHAAAGEVVEKPLGRGLVARVPLALHSRNGRTLRPSGAPSPDALRSALAAVSRRPAEATDPSVRLAGVVIAWNVFEHFYPYFDRIDADWDAVLTEGLRRALADETRADHLDTLRWLTARLEDGHAGVYMDDREPGLLPTPLGVVEGELVVLAVPEEEECVRPGDRLRALDGRPATAELERWRGLLSGSRWWSTHRALIEMGRGPVDGEAVLTLERGGEEVTCRPRRVPESAVVLSEPRPEPIAELRPGILYADLTRLDDDTLEARLDDLAAAAGVVFDLRGYPRVRPRILRHVARETVRSALFETPRVIYPGGRDVSHDDAGRWTLPPLTPHIGGRVAFLTDGRAISYAESVLGIVEAHGLGEIVGSPTAGANGNINRFVLPGGFPLLFTGMRVRKHDGSPHHLVGILPTVPAGRTLEGVRAGRDEVLEAALERLSGGGAR